MVLKSKVSNITFWFLEVNNLNKLGKKENYRNWALRAAKELFYNKEIIEQIKKAKTDQEIDQIMRSARHNK